MTKLNDTTFASETNAYVQHNFIQSVLAVCHCLLKLNVQINHMYNDYVTVTFVLLAQVGPSTGLYRDYSSPSIIAQHAYIGPECLQRKMGQLVYVRVSLRVIHRPKQPHSLRSGQKKHLEMVRRTQLFNRCSLFYYSYNIQIKFGGGSSERQCMPPCEQSFLSGGSLGSVQTCSFGFHRRPRGVTG